MAELKIVPVSLESLATFPRTKYLTMTQFRQEIIPWSDDTIRRRVREDGLPAIHDGRKFLFDRAEVEAWFKRRSFK